MVRVVFHHAPERALPAEATEVQEIRAMRIVEDSHAYRLTPTNPRIGYQFGVFESGRAYEGVGYNRIGAHVANNNTLSFGICLFLNGQFNRGTDAAWDTIREIIAEGVFRKAIVENPIYVGHRRYVNTACPGDVLNAFVHDLTHSELMNPPKPASPQPGERVWSNHFGEHLILTEYRSDDDWSFIRESQLRSAGIKATSPWSQMPPAKG